MFREHMVLEHHEKKLIGTRIHLPIALGKTGIRTTQGKQLHVAIVPHNTDFNQITNVKYRIQDSPD
jgi:hypothetical protein